MPDARSGPRLGPEDPLTAVAGIGPVRGRQLAAAGLESVADLLARLPLRYEDRRRLFSLDEVTAPGWYSFAGRICGLSTVRVRRRRLTLVRGRLIDGASEMPVVWFNRPYVGSQIDEKAELLVHGAVRQRREGWELVNPSLEARATASLAGTIVPVYGAIGELGPAFVRRTVRAILATLDWSRVEDPMPTTLLASHDLPPLAAAWSGLHAPPPDAEIEELNRRSTPFHKRLVYGELLDLQLRLAAARDEVASRPKAYRYSAASAAARRAEEGLPFTLTGGQRRAWTEILADLEAPHPMARLLQGDVGCGKTAVAALALAVAAENGLQGALMVPTELLAEQQHRAVLRLLGDARPIALLTSSVADLDAQRDRLATGEAALAVGTHALIQETVRFSRLALVVIDEQHRFGVAQRRELQLKGRCPDLLVMTATPIPRSLTLAVYGDLSVSVIDELPPGRQPVVTRVAARAEREDAYDEVERRLERGERAYVVLPLIDESRDLDAEAVEGLGRELETRFRGYRPVIVHGRTEAAERAARMEEFAAGSSRVVIATTLIEVGLDVPEATVMVIESAERFGLSQLHQLRGRVGRGRRPALCIALHGTLSTEAAERLKIFAATSDGFELAEADLGIRGPGDVLGTRQSGAPVPGLADFIRDRKWLERARRDARRLVAEDREQALRVARRLGARRGGDPLAGG